MWLLLCPVPRSKDPRFKNAQSVLYCFISGFVRAGRENCYFYFTSRLYCIFFKTPSVITPAVIDGLYFLLLVGLILGFDQFKKETKANKNHRRDHPKLRVPYV